MGTTPSGDPPVMDDQENHPIGRNTKPKLVKTIERQAGTLRRALRDRDGIREWTLDIAESAKNRISATEKRNLTPNDSKA